MPIWPLVNAGLALECEKRKYISINVVGLLLKVTTFKSRITHTFVNGQLVYQNAKVNEAKAGKRLLFNR
jgi:hypothetical protein